MSISALDAAIEIARRKHNKTATVKVAPSNSEAQKMTGADLRLLVGITSTEGTSVRKVKTERVKVAGTDADKRKRPRVFMADGVTPVPESLKSQAAAIYESGKRGAEYHKACAKAGIPTTRTVWVGDKLRLAK